MTRCISPGCTAFGRDLQDDEMEFMPAAGVYVCRACWGAVEDAPPPPPSQVAPATPAPPTEEGLLKTAPQPDMPKPWEVSNQTSPTAMDVKSQAQEDVPNPRLPLVPETTQVAGEVEEDWELSLESKPSSSGELATLPTQGVSNLVSDEEGESEVGAQSVLPTGEAEPPWEVRVDSRPWPVVDVTPTTPSEAPGLEINEEGDVQFEIEGAQAFPIIVVYQGGKVRGRYEVCGDQFLIGRPSRHSPIPPQVDFSGFTDGKQVSRRHARIVQCEGQYFVEDLGSARGTWLNGEWLPPNVPRRLEDDDTISIAGVADLEFQMPGRGIVGSEYRDEDEFGEWSEY